MATLRRISAVVVAFIERQMRRIKGFLLRAWFAAKTRAIRTAVFLINHTRRVIALLGQWLRRMERAVLEFSTFAWREMVRAAIATRNVVLKALLSLRSLCIRVWHVLSRSFRSTIAKTERTIHEVETDIHIAAIRVEHIAKETEINVIAEEKKEMTVLRNAIQGAVEKSRSRVHSLRSHCVRSCHRARNRAQHMSASIRKHLRHWRNRSHRHPPSVPGTHPLS
jgi:hypothetical protein